MSDPEAAAVTVPGLLPASHQAVSHWHWPARTVPGPAAAVSLSASHMSLPRCQPRPSDSDPTLLGPDPTLRIRPSDSDPTLPSSTRLLLPRLSPSLSPAATRITSNRFKVVVRPTRAGNVARRHRDRPGPAPGRRDAQLELAYRRGPPGPRRPRRPGPGCGSRSRVRQQTLTGTEPALARRQPE